MSLVRRQQKVGQVYRWFPVPCRASQGGSRRVRTDLKLLYWFHRYRLLTLGSYVRVYVGLFVPALIAWLQDRSFVFNIRR